MRKLSLTFFILIWVWGTAFAQYPAKYWIQFKDKANSSYSVNKPEEFLSPRAIEKRARFNIPITEEDLPVNSHYIAEVLKIDSGIVLFTKSKWHNAITVYAQDSFIMDKIMKLPFVKTCERTISMEEPELFQDINFSYQSRGEVTTSNSWKSDFKYGKSEEQIRLNNIHWLHRMGYLGDNMVMMVMDAGFHNSDTLRYFNLLREENRLLGVRNFVELGVNPFRKASHGTMVLSCIASYIPGELVGSAPKISVYLAKTEDDRSENKVEEDNWVAGVEWADSLGVDLLNSSLGYTKFDDSTHKRIYQDLTGKVSRASQAATIAARKGLLICNSAGNEGSKKWHYIGCPADAEGILSVGATDVYGNRAPFSSYGPTADGRIKPDVLATGYNTYVANPRSKTIQSNGTSFSSPVLAGMAACLWQAFPEKSNMEIMNAIRQSGDNATTPNDTMGYGIADFLKAYNILKYNNLNYHNPDNSIIIQLSDYDFKGKTISFIIISKSEQVISTDLYFKNLGKTIFKTHKLIAGENQIKIKIPKIKTDYDFIQMNIRTENSEINYLLGIE